MKPDTIVEVNGLLRNAEMEAGHARTAVGNSDKAQALYRIARALKDLRAAERGIKGDPQ